MSGKTTNNSARPTKQKSPFREEKPDPYDQWSEQAEQFTAECFGHLLQNPEGRKHLDWLQSARGISIGTAQTYGLGWNNEDRYLDQRDWGLPVNGKKLFLPVGLVIPTFKNETMIRLRIRKPQKDDYGRYYIVSGSKTNWSKYGEPSANTIIVESDLDAILINQELNIRCYAMTSTSLSPTRAEFDELMRSQFVIDSLDSDPAGIKKTYDIEKLFGAKYRRFPPIVAKDIGDMYQAGVSIREWYQAGLMFFNLAA